MHRGLGFSGSDDGASAPPRQVDTVKGENTQLRDENGVLKDYLNNLMAKACDVGWFVCPEEELLCSSKSYVVVWRVTAATHEIDRARCLR